MRGGQRRGFGDFGNLIPRQMAETLKGCCDLEEGGFVVRCFFIEVDFVVSGEKEWMEWDEYRCCGGFCRW